MRQTHEWPGHWMPVAPRVEDHPEGAELAWLARGHPFTRPVLARSNVGLKRAPTWEPRWIQRSPRGTDRSMTAQMGAVGSQPE
jgi:hypothetical protein